MNHWKEATIGNFQRKKSLSFFFGGSQIFPIQLSSVSGIQATSSYRNRFSEIFFVIICRFGSTWKCTKCLKSKNSFNGSVGIFFDDDFVGPPPCDPWTPFAHFFPHTWLWCNSQHGVKLLLRRISDMHCLILYFIYTYTVYIYTSYIYK